MKSSHTVCIAVAICALCCIAAGAQGQTQFIHTGRIEFEKKVNIQKETENDHWLDGLRDKLPKFRTSLHNLYFRDGKTLFEKGTDVYEKIPFMGDDRSVDDVVYTDLRQGIFLKKQAVFDETFLLSDSIRPVKWQMTNELRDIAGFECHKAVGKILDSVYVIAFYTDQITVSGGPLSFCNLPGMILGIAIPRNNLTVFATKVELTEPGPQKMAAPAGKKKTTYKALHETITKALADWGSYSKKYIITSMY
ncbi:GLPGLI family protein [Sediminibacterium soli]|uniref:GLPGLI family protein n=1 Tax=Sediminibacterium soli TaxID=2698829 RepID=UPI001379CB96|nr:GLPGLI family protein [Sediminibacterium soli]NCI46483.1 GLPGLI family protein [Sediminibacterium soli]